jgi:hypothetical protein
MAGILATKQILSLFFHHVFQKHPAQLRDRALLITDAEEAMDIAKFMKLIFRPALKLFLCQPTAEKKLADRMRPRVALLQSMLKIGDQFCRGK